MRLAHKPILALTIGIFAVMAANGYARVQREITLVVAAGIGSWFVRWPVRRLCEKASQVGKEVA
jgi:hypothetical protein